MKINEVMIEASVNRKIVGQPQAHANQKTNIARSAAFRAQMDAKPEEPAAAPVAPASGTPNYGAGGAETPQTQVTPVSKVTGQPAPTTGQAPTPTASKPAGTPPSEVTLANPISNTPTAAAAASGGTATPAAPKARAAKSRFPNLQKIATGVGQVASGVGGALGSVIKGANDAIKTGGGGNKYGSLASIQDTSTSATGVTPTATPSTTEPTTTATGATPTAKPGATPPAGAKPGAAAPVGGATPDLSAKPQTQDSPVAKPAGATPDISTKPAATPVTAKAPAQGKVMSKQEILSWISRNDEDNAALQGLKDAIASAEKSAPAAATTTPNYGKDTPGVQNTQVTPDKIRYPNYDEVTGKITSAGAAKKAADDADHEYQMKNNPRYAQVMQQFEPAANQTQLASKQYKKAPL